MQFPDPPIRFWNDEIESCLKHNRRNKENLTMAKKKKKTNPMNNTVAKREAKKAAVLGTEKKGRLPLMVAFVCALIIVGGGIFYVLYNPSDGSPVAAAASPAGAAHPPRQRFLPVYLRTARRVISSILPAALPLNILSSKAPTVSFGPLMMPAMSAGGPVRAIIRRVIIWFAEIAAGGLLPFW
jgi:hypothetical protein